MIDGHEVRDGISVTDVKKLTLKPVAQGEGVTLQKEWPTNASTCCAVTLRVLRDSTSGEHKFKLMSLLLGGADAGSIQLFSMRVAASAAEDVAHGRARHRRRWPAKGRVHK